jgi:hypothetical protein
LSELFRDPRYVIPLIMLMFVIVVSAATGAGPGAVDSAVPSLPYVPREEGVPAPDLARDYARGVDLGKLREAALGYYRQAGSFPDTENQAVAICEDGANSACALRLVQEDLPLDDGEHPYYYASDGMTYALFIAKAEVKGDMSQCPELVPVELASSPLMCTRLEAPQ